MHKHSKRCESARVGPLVRQSASRRRQPAQRGQALVEFLYVALLMVPVFLLLPMIGKYQDVSHATQMASRYAAFDSMAHHAGTTAGLKAPEVMANEIRQRFFGSSQAFIQAADGQAASAPHNPAWQTPFGQRLIASPEKDIRVTYGNPGRTQPADGYLDASDRGIFNQQGSTGAGLANAMKLPGGGLFQVNVSVRLANLPDQLALIEPFSRINLDISRATVVLHEAWSANHPNTVETRTAALVPVAQELRNMEPALDLLIQGVDDMGRVRAPRFNRLDQWRDLVPRDRIR